MFVRLKDGTSVCITNENDIADIIEQYCGTELSDVIRNSEYIKLYDAAIKLNNVVSSQVYMNDNVKISKETEKIIEEALIELQKYI